MPPVFMAPPPCLQCGTCCFSDSDEYVLVTGDDHVRLGDDADRYVDFLGNRAFMRMLDGHCAALEIDHLRRRFVCAVYERRPQICRELDRGSPQCLGERAVKRDRPLRALQRKPAA